MNYSWLTYAFLSAMFAALVAIFGKLGVSKIDSTVATMVRSIIMAVFLFVLVLVIGKIHLVATFDKRAIIFIVAAGIAGALSWLFYFFALKVGPPTGVVAVDRLSVVFVVIFSALFLSDKMTWQTIVGSTILTAGAILMAWK